MIDPSIALNVRGFNLGELSDAYMQARQAGDQMRANKLQQTLGQIQLGEAQDEQKYKKTLNGLIQVNTDDTPSGLVLNEDQTIKDLNRLGYGQRAIGLQTEFRKNRTDLTKQRRQEYLDRLDTRSRILNGATPEDYSDRLKRLQNLGDDLEGIPRKFDANAVQQHLNEVLSRKDLLEQQNKTAETADKVAKTAQEAAKNTFEQGPKFQEDKRHHDLQYQVGMAQAQNAANSGTKPQRLPADKVVSLSDQRTGVQMLDKEFQKLKKLRPNGGDGILTPILGPARALNPWDTNAQDLNSYVGAVKQVIGKSLEGGVLRKEDEAKYEKIIPRFGDMPETLAAKYQNLRDLIASKHNNEIDSYQRAGYVTGELQPIAGAQPAAVPGGAAPGGAGGAPRGQVKAGKGGFLIYRPNYGG